jgi:hypothetical protein
MNTKILKTLLIISALSLSSTAFATMTLNNDASTVLGGGTYKPSTNVTLSATSTTSQYSAIAGHLNGNKEFLTNNEDPKIYEKDKASGTVATSCDSATFSTSGWTAR